MMKKTALISIFALLALVINAAKPLDYYLPENTQFDSKIPKPADVLDYEVGEWMVTHDQLINYIKAIAASTDRAYLMEYARSHENRPLYQIIFSSPENIKNLETLRRDHLQMADPYISENLDVEKMPIIVRLGYSVHGNEASGVNSSLLTMYYLAAAKGNEFEAFLKNTVIIVDPAMNPDGVNRFANWVNMHKSKSEDIDPSSRIFNEVWPGGRTNHYWFDLNRDYIMLTHPESQGKVDQLQKWLPNIVTDHHEMGSNSTFFFQPGVPSRVNPLTPTKNQLLTEKIGNYHAKFLDKIKSLYFTEEIFDDYYYGKGSAYPDITSGIGILFEQARTRGFKVETENGVMDFPYTIKNQFIVTLSTLEAAKNMRLELLNYQREFFKSVFEQADKDNVKAIVFGGVDDQGRVMELVKILNNHHIDVCKLKGDFEMNGKKFSSSDSYIVPFKQKNHLFIKSLFERNKFFQDRTFYDVSTWNMTMSFNLYSAELYDMKTLNKVKGEKLGGFALDGQLVQDAKEPVAWVFEWDEYYAPRALSELLSLGLRVKVAQKKFGYKTANIQKDFDYGSILIPASNQNLSMDEIQEKLQDIAADNGLSIYALRTSLTPKGIDIGSTSFAKVKQAKIMMFVEGNSNSRDAGEIWHLFDDRYNQPITLLEVDRVHRADLNDYNVIILPGGSYNDLGEKHINRLKLWVQNGGTLIAYKGATKWANTNLGLGIKFKAAPKVEKKNLKYDEMYADANVQAITGAIFNTNMDLSHPLAYGYSNTNMPVFKTGTMVADLGENPYASPIKYDSNPLLSGYSSAKNRERISGAPFVTVNRISKGKVICIFDNTNFRGFWYGSNKVFANAVYFGDLIRLDTRRYYED